MLVQPPQTASAEQLNAPPPIMTVPAPAADAPAPDVTTASPVALRRGITEKANKASNARVATTAAIEVLPSTAIVFPVTLPSGVGDTTDVVSPTTTSTPASTDNADAAGLAPVTLTGCLEISVDDERFRLTDTQGTNVPKARSWRSGFLTKRSAPVALVEIADPLAVRKFVGQRVVATGVVENREMRVRSLQAAGAACGR